MAMSSSTKEQPRSRLRADQRRAQVMETAGRLFGERGYGGVTLDEVAAAAGVTKPVLYRHFPSKKALYLALLERHRADLPRFFERVPADDARVLRGGAEEQPVSFSRRIEVILETWFAYVEEH